MQVSQACNACDAGARLERHERASRCSRTVARRREHNPVLSAEQSFRAAEVHALLAIEQRLGELLSLLRPDALVGQIS